MDYKAIFENIVEAIKANVTGNHTHIYGSYSNFYPQMQFITVDLLDEKDWPHNIERNSVSITFKLDLEAKKVEIFSYGHIWLTKADMDASHLAMASLKDIFEFHGEKWFRKQSFKGVEDLTAKIKKVHDTALKVVNKHTGGYPYKEGIVNIYTR